MQTFKFSHMRYRGLNFLRALFSFTLSLVLLGVCLLGGVVDSEAAGNSMSYQGVLRGKDGKKLAEQRFGLRFSLWSDADYQDGSNYGYLNWSKEAVVDTDKEGVITYEIQNLPNFSQYKSDVYLQIQIKNDGASRSNYEVLDSDPSNTKKDRLLIYSSNTESSGVSAVTKSVAPAVDTSGLAKLDSERVEFSGDVSAKAFQLSDLLNCRQIATDVEGKLVCGRDRTGGSSVWGTITGTLSEQSDLQAALDGKMAAGTITALGTITSGVWEGSAIADAYISSAATWNAKEDAISNGTTSQYFRGDKTWQTLNASAVGLSNVENTKLSTWVGSDSITNLGTIGTGTWNATPIGISKGGTGEATAQAAINVLTQVSSATDEYVLTKDASTGNAIWKASATGGLGSVVQDTTPQLGGNLDLNNKNITGTGNYQGTPIADAYISSAATWNAKEDAISTGTTSQYFRGDKTWQTLNASAVGLGDVTNESKATMFSSPSFTGTVTLPTGLSGLTKLTSGVVSAVDEANYLNSNITLGSLGAAASGANSDITSLTGVTNLQVGGGYGSTGLTIDTDGNLSTDGNITLTGDIQVADVVFYDGHQKVSDTLKVGVGVDGTDTDYILVAADGTISDNGGNVTIDDDLTVTGTTILGSLTGLLKGTSGTVGVAVAGSDYYAPGSTDVAVADGGTGKSSVTANSYLKGNGTDALVERTYAEVKTDLGLNNVENTALSTWSGSSNITTLGNVGTGTWNGTAIGISKGGTGQTNQTASFDALAPTTTKGDITVFNGTDNIRLPVGSNDQVLTADSTQASGVKWASISASGDVSGPASSTDNAIVRFNGAGGKTIQNSSVTISDTNILDAVGFTEGGGNILSNDISGNAATATTASEVTCTGCVAEAEIAQNTLDDSEIQDNTLTAASLAENSVGDSEMIDSPTFVDLNSIAYIYGDYGTIARSTDEWLRLNDGDTHTNGIYIGSATRIDGEIQQGVNDYGAYEIQTGGQAYVNDYLVAMGGVHVGGTSDPGTDNLLVDGTATATSFLYSSDRNLKKDIVGINGALDKVLQLEGVTFNWKDNDEADIGLIAQDVEKVFPELVSTNEVTGLKSVKYGNLVAPLIEAVKEQQKQNEAQQRQIEQLMKEINSLKQLED